MFSEMQPMQQDDTKGSQNLPQSSQNLRRRETESASKLRVCRFSRKSYKWFEIHLSDWE